MFTICVFICSTNLRTHDSEKPTADKRPPVQAMRSRDRGIAVMMSVGWGRRHICKWGGRARTDSKGSAFQDERTACQRDDHRILEALNHIRYSGCSYLHKMLMGHARGIIAGFAMCFPTCQEAQSFGGLVRTMHACSHSARIFVDLLRRRARVAQARQQRRGRGAGPPLRAGMVAGVFIACIIRSLCLFECPRGHTNRGAVIHQ